ncbi:MAG: RsmB/NOP family class I SAM-dependent RNA methyltransferase [Nevskiales bacterium]|nr:RsmB/NOP family class I SAM-dependent RNA methyltransferase [Nevskiales bacterium]
MTEDTIGSGHPKTPATGLRVAQLQIAAQALTTILRADNPADAVLQNLFRRNRKAGAKDRARISALVYGVLRNYFRLRAALNGHATALELCAAHVLQTGMDSLPPMQELDITALRTRLLSFDTTSLTAAARHNLPDWLWEKLRAQYGETEASTLALALNRQASVDLRVNTLKTSREAAIQALSGDGIAAEPTPHSSLGLRLQKRVALQNSRAFRAGLVEPQDEGSQLLTLFVNPRPGEKIADFCAGAGGKTLALGALMENRGELHAFDISGSRLSRLADRLKRSGLTRVQVQQLHDEHDADLEQFVRQFDAVLADVPCSGTGTLRRRPELRLQNPSLPALQQQQLSILTAASRLVRRGGRLVYATCSVLQEENQDRLRAFLSTHPSFVVEQERQWLPHRDGTDGFYAAALRAK